MTIYNEISTGKLIIAEPFSLEPHFKRSVVLLCNHDAEGSFGYIINKMLDMKLNEVMADFPEFNAPLFYGGPVQTDSLHFLHNVGDLLVGSKRISSGVYIGVTGNNSKYWWKRN